MKFYLFCSIAILISGCSNAQKHIQNIEKQISSSEISQTKIYNFDIIENESVTGKLHRFDSFASNFIIPRTVDVWLPENYSANKKYAVLYMNDGQDLFDPLVNKRKPEIEIDETITRLVSEEKIKDAIVVGIYNIPNERSEDYFPQKPIDLLPVKTKDSLLRLVRAFNKSFNFNSDDYLKFLTQELKPYIDANYSTATDVTNTYIAGASMGGLISMYAVCEYPQIFGGAIGMSTHWVGAVPSDGNPIPPAFFNYMRKNLPPPDTHKFYFSFGTKGLDMFYTQYEDEVNNVFNERGYTTNNVFRNIKTEGGNHNVPSWQERFPEAVQMMIGK
ncbi:esterase [Patiriisocius marinistellae]|uniref:Esterase n=1 Tax=Patiriisocius marinistellae TaxID=2494560 RepID=A0A5J4FU46_9FLAO|nr:alpha/beta hydrolase-fold protein [Patiriisocius marinistellae]GEQ86147.1 esterase [Patiriisocius marinistellae]